MILTLEQQVVESVAFVGTRIALPQRLGLILGSGLGDFADTLSGRSTLDTREIPHYPATGVGGHRGRLVFGELSGVRLVAFQGRPHFYESGLISSVLYPVRIAKGLGVTSLIITNAAGGISRSLVRGDLMLITDQIDLTGEVLPLRSLVLREGKQQVYDVEFGERLQEIAREMAIALRRGVYAGVKGPSYETAAEVEMIRRLGGDAVGMSTVLESAMAAALGIRVLGISCITNLATGISAGKLSHDEVTAVSVQVRERFQALLSRFIASIGTIALP